MRLPSKYNGYAPDGVRTCFKGGVQSTTTSIPNELKPLAKAYTEKATALSDTPFQAYDGQRFADLNGYQTQGADAIYNRAMNGSQEINAGSGMLTDTLNGNYLNGNQYLDAAYDSAARGVTKNYQNAMHGTNAQMNSASEAFGGSGWQQAQQNNSEALAQGLGDMGNQMYYGNYAQERGNQLNAAGQALGYGNQSYTDAGQMIKAGQMYQDQAQQGLDFNYQQFQDAQNDPYKKLAAMSGVFGSNLGMTQKTSGGGK